MRHWCVSRCTCLQAMHPLLLPQPLCMQEGARVKSTHLLYKAWQLVVQRSVDAGKGSQRGAQTQQDSSS